MEEGVSKRIGLVTESAPGETRVAGTPSTVRQLIGLGYEVVVSTGAGVASGFPDGAYAEAGAGIVADDEAWRSGVVMKVNAPTLDEVAKMIADKTGGRFFRARDAAELAGIYAELDRLEPVATAAAAVQPRIERYEMPLALALLFGLLHLAWPRRLR